MESETRPNLLGLSRANLRTLFTELGEKPFRAEQILKWIHQRGVLDLDAMTDISKVLRERLRESTVISLPRVVQDFPSEDGSRKWIIEVASGSRVEMVFIPEAGRGTLCVSSQAGCSLDCSFCATGKQGFNSNLTSAEIIGQLWWANKELGGFSGTATDSGGTRVSNVVMMGMGEPLLNFDNVMEAIDLMMDDCAYGLSKRKVTISTSGVVPAIERLKDFTDASLAISLHAPNDELRSKIMPINRRYPIAQLLAAVRTYMESLPDRRVPVIEYTLIKGVNDHRQHARELAELLRDFPCKINLIPFNPFALSDYRRPSASAISNFRQILQQAGYTVTVRTTRADDIGAACGQLVGEVADLTRRHDRHIRKTAEKAGKVFDTTDNLAVAADRLE
ncbi:MAG: 23S rRNA (adenine(2503)-C(2))-methyltransferase RlmN [Proteobacteria bacterium]|nr:23S rRNA (adenine(2503)-C(2))-methyltransferase RlmN [Pseudomonadota bacterium]MDA0929082.1 23S rRNA (adenine(2503)-C(2))-methyltransferase RlmN [Pseudomonadota bacterium]